MAVQESRLMLKPEAPVSGFVDGAWWPRSDDLAEELPGLLTGLSTRTGAIERVSYSLDQWAATPRRITHAGRSVRMEGYHSQPADTIGLSDGRSRVLVLLVVPAQTDPEHARSILAAAAAGGDASSVEALLAAGR